MVALGEMADFAQKPPPLAFSAVGLIVYRSISFRCVDEEISLYRFTLGWIDADDFVHPLNLVIYHPFESLARFECRLASGLEILLLLHSHQRDLIEENSMLHTLAYLVCRFPQYA